MTEIEKIKQAERDKRIDALFKEAKEKSDALVSVIGDSWREMKIRPGKQFGFTNYDYTLYIEGHRPIYVRMDLCGQNPYPFFRVNTGFWPFNDYSVCNNFASALIAAERK